MALTLFIFKVSNLELSKSKSESNSNISNSTEALLETAKPINIVNENTTFLTAKVTFRGKSNSKKTTFPSIQS